MNSDELESEVFPDWYDQQDWKGHIPEEVRREWPSLSPAVRACLHELASYRADRISAAMDL